MRDFVYRVFGFYKDISYKNKLILSYTAFIIIPVLFVSSFIYRQLVRTTEQQAILLMEQGLERACVTLENQLTSIEKISDLISSNMEIRDILEKDPARTSISDQIDDYNTIDAYFTNILLINSAVYRVRLYVNSGFIYANQNSITFNIDTILNNERAGEQLDLSGRILFTDVYEYNYLYNEPKRIVSAYRIIRSISDISRSIGIISIDIPEENILSILQTTNLTGGGAVVLLNNKNQQICVYNPNGMEYPDDLLDDSHSNNSGNDTVLVRSRTLDASGWRMISLVPTSELLQKSILLRKQIIIFAFGIGLLVYIMAYFLAQRNTQRINRLIGQMKKAEGGDLEALCEVDSSDEIGMLECSFNFMIRKMKVMVAQQYKLGQNIKSIELQFLQAQIKPHFLYNTLDLVYWTAREGNMAKVCALVSSLVNYYRTSLSRGREFISIREELANVAFYVDIQNQRYNDAITLIVQVDEALCDHRILKLTLQPLAENAILHGIMEKDDGRGILRIRAELCESDIEIQISDDGVGMTMEKCDSILSRAQDEGYGVKNIHDRLRLYYGDRYGLRYRSQPGAGTTVTVRIPSDASLKAAGSD